MKVYKTHVLSWDVDQKVPKIDAWILKQYLATLYKKIIFYCNEEGKIDEKEFMKSYNSPLRIKLACTIKCSLIGHIGYNSLLVNRKAVVWF